MLTFNIDDRWGYKTALVAIPVPTTKKGIFVHHQNITEVLLVNVNSMARAFWCLKQLHVVFQLKKG